MEQIFQALTDPHRRQIVQMLLCRPQPVGHLVRALPIAQSGVSRHLRILRAAGVVQSKAVGQQRIYSLCPEPFQQLSDWLGDYRQLWEARLDQFEVELERRKLTLEHDKQE